MSEVFPTLEKAFISEFRIDRPAIAIGQVNTGASLNFVRITGGSFKSVEGFSGPRVEGTVVEGEDWITADNDGKRLRLNAKILFKTHDDAIVVFSYTGIITLTPEIGLVLAGDEARQTVPFGNIVSSGKFETGDSRYKELENHLFVGTGRFTVSEGAKSTAVEYTLSRLIAA